MRGSRQYRQCELRAAGIIPAGAGLTRAPVRALVGRRDHPRGCGAHPRPMQRKKWLQGSSPRVRGSPEKNNKYHRGFGIIPAGAGLTRCSNNFLSLPRDHPRGCGAHPCKNPFKGGSEGSSPRVRGSPGMGKSDKRCPGIIPAGAGLTALVVPPTRSIRDHPRGCGAHSKRSQYSCAFSQISSLILFIFSFYHILLFLS